MVLKKVKRKAVSTNPSTLLLYGAPKVGKTTMLSKLDDCLIIDTEKGSRMIEGYIQEVNSRDELINMLIDIKIFVITACAISNVLTKATASSFS